MPNRSVKSARPSGSRDQGIGTHVLYEYEAVGTVDALRQVLDVPSCPAFGRRVKSKPCNTKD